MFVNSIFRRLNFHRFNFVYLAVMDFLLYDTTLEEAKDKKQELINAFAELLAVNPKEVDLVFKEDENGRILSSFVLSNPSVENKDLCSTPQLPARLRGKIVQEDILPKQERNHFSLENLTWREKLNF